MRPLRFLCFNIHGGRALDGRRDAARVHALLEDLDIDIGVFQEMETRRSRGAGAEDIELLAGGSRPHRLAGKVYEAADGWFGNLIVSRYPIVRGLVHQLETAGHLEPRNAADALIAAPQGRIRVIGTHLSLSMNERWSEASNLLRLAQSVEDSERNPFFLMGDINEWRWRNRLLRHMNKIMIPLPTGPSFPSWLPLFRLDRAWHDVPGLKATARVLKTSAYRKLSDHLPLLIEVEF